MKCEYCTLTSFEESNPRDVPLELVHQVVRHFFPEIQKSDVRFHYHGTYNVFEVKGEYIFRFPGRSLFGEEGFDLIHREKEVLELLKRPNKSTFVYELSTKDGSESFGMIDSGRVYSRPYLPVRARARGDSGRLSQVLDAFLASGDDELRVEDENPGLTGYYLNKLIMERGLGEGLEVAVESGSCYLRRVAQ